MKKLKPCPLCGNRTAPELIIHSGENIKTQYTITCNVLEGGCGCETGYMCSEEKVIKAWNNRKKPDPMITKKEWDFLSTFIDSEELYFARNMDNSLSMFFSPPKKEDTYWRPLDNQMNKNSVCINAELFPFITWEESEVWTKKLF